MRSRPTAPPCTASTRRVTGGMYRYSIPTHTKLPLRRAAVSTRRQSSTVVHSGFSTRIAFPVSRA